MKRRTLIAAAVVIALAHKDAGADDSVAWTHLKTQSTVVTGGGSVLVLPPGYFAPEETWITYDLEMKRLQERETRLAAENASLRKSADEISFGWKTLGVVAVVAFTVGGVVTGRALQ